MPSLRRVGSLLSVLLLAARTTAAQGGVILGAVEDSTGRAIPDVRVTVLGETGTLVTDASGRFQLGPVRGTTYLLQLRRLGHAAVTTVVTVRSTDTVRLDIELTPTATVLAPVDVTADPTTAKLERVGFLRRRLDPTVPASRFLTRAEFDKRPPLTVSELLQRMGAYTRRCPSGEAIYVDGALLAPPIPKDSVVRVRPSKNSPMLGPGGDGLGSALPPVSPVDMIPPKLAEAIEAYVGPAEIPLEFKAAGRGLQCVVLIWTRDR